MKREIDSIHVNRDTAHARCVIRTDFHGIGHPTLSLVISWCVGVCGVPVDVTRQKRNGGCPPKKHPWESPDRAAERENVQTWRRAATKKNSDVGQLLKISRCSGPAMNVPPLKMDCDPACGTPERPLCAHFHHRDPVPPLPRRETLFLS